MADPTGTIFLANGHFQMTDVVKVFDGETIAASESATSAPIKITRAKGVFSLCHIITGDGTLKFEYLVSHDGTNFVTPSGGSDIAADKTVASGTSGVDVIAFPDSEPPISAYIKIKATETGGANSATLTGYLAVQ